MRRLAGWAIWGMVVGVVLPAHAVDSRHEPDATPAPTQAVTTKALDNPKFQSDTRSIQAIIDREGETARIGKTVNVSPEDARPSAVVDKAIERPAASALAPRAAAPAVKTQSPPPASAKPQPVVESKVEPKPAPSPEPETLALEAVVGGTGIQIVHDEEKGWLERYLTSLRIFAIRWHEVLDIVLVGMITLFTGLLYRLSRTQQKILLQTIRAMDHAALVARRSTEKAEMLMKDAAGTADGTFR